MAERASLWLSGKENPSAKAGDVDLIPDAGGSHNYRTTKPGHHNHRVCALEPGAAATKSECCNH